MSAALNVLSIYLGFVYPADENQEAGEVEGRVPDGLACIAAVCCCSTLHRCTGLAS
jgi:hypothetical protein